MKTMSWLVHSVMHQPRQESTTMQEPQFQLLY